MFSLNAIDRVFVVFVCVPLCGWLIVSLKTLLTGVIPSSMVVVPSKPGTGADSTHSIVYGDRESSVFRHLVIPTDGSAIASPGVELSTPNMFFSAITLLTVHADPTAAGALYLSNFITIWYRDGNGAMSVVAGSSIRDYADGVGDAARFLDIAGLLHARRKDFVCG